MSGNKPGASTSEAAFPWNGQPDEAACTAAYLELIDYLRAKSRQGDRTHAETLLTAAGTVAGLGARFSLLSDALAVPVAHATGRLSESMLGDGRLLLDGEALMDMLMTGDPALARSRVWNLAVAVAKSRGLKETEIPDVQHMYNVVKSRIATPLEGWPSTPHSHQPLEPATAILPRIANGAIACLTGANRKTGGAAHKSWVAVTAQAAAVLVLDASQAIQPGQCCIIVMEAALHGAMIRAPAPKPN